MICMTSTAPRTLPNNFRTLLAAGHYAISQLATAYEIAMDRARRASHAGGGPARAYWVNLAHDIAEHVNGRGFVLRRTFDGGYTYMTSAEAGRAEAAGRGVA